MRNLIIGLIVAIVGPAFTLVMQHYLERGGAWVWNATAFVCIVGGLLIIALTDPVYPYLQSFRDHPKGALSLVLFLFAVIGAAATLLYIKSTGSVTIDANFPAKPNPIIRLDYNPVGDYLPLSIAPRQTISVIYIDEDGGLQFMQHKNLDHTNPLLWPRNPPPPKIPVATLRATNVGEVNAFSVTIRVLCMIGGDNIPGGLKKQEIDLLPSIDLRSGGHDEQIFYVVNKSLSLPAALWISPAATGQVQGEQHIRPLQVTVAGFVMSMLYTDSTTGRKFLGPCPVAMTTYKWPK